MENGQYGPIAQLGERTVRIRKVVGSNPFRSTKKIRDTLSRVSYFFGIRGTFNSAQTNELLVHQGFRTAKTLVTRHSARFLFHAPQAA